MVIVDSSSSDSDVHFTCDDNEDEEWGCRWGQLRIFVYYGKDNEMCL